MPAMKIVIDTAMRARDVSRPQPEDVARAEAADAAARAASPARPATTARPGRPGAAPAARETAEQHGPPGRGNRR